jgi:hypothetical protein
MGRSRLEVADVFRRYGEAFRQRYGASLSGAQRRVMTAIELCRTAALVAYTTDNGVTKTLAVSRGHLGATWWHSTREAGRRAMPRCGELMRMLLPKGSLRSCRTAGRRELAT